MRVVRLAVLAGFLATSHSFNGRAILLQQLAAEQRSLSIAEQATATVPITLGKVQGGEGTNPVNGPLSSQSSASAVDKTEDMTFLEDATEGEHPGTKKLENSATARHNSQLTENGNADKVKPLELEQEKHSATAMWNIEDLTRPLCRNCKAIVDYELWLNKYRHHLGAQTTLIILAAMLIWLLGTTAQDFFVPPLLYWSERLQLRPELAGATLLALGNGAPDIFSVCTAAHKGDLPLAVSEMLGSNMFTLCFTGGILGACCFMLPDKEGKFKNATRVAEQVPDHRLFCYIGIYAITIGVLAWVLLSGTPTFLKAICLPLVYGLYLLMVVHVGTDDNTTSSDSQLEAARDAVPANDTSGEIGEALAEATETGEPCPMPLAGLEMPKDASPLALTMWGLSLPSYLVRWACIPPVDRQWDPVRRLTSSIAPIGMLAFCAIVNVARLQEIGFIAQVGFVMLACLAGISIYLSSGPRPVLPWFYPVLPMFALLASVIWMAVLAGEITALVEAIGYTLRVPRLRLGYTAIAWGNCLADFLVLLATLRKGHAVMAITAIFAGPLLDDLIAFGAALIMVSWERGIPVMCGPDCPKEFKEPLVTSLCFILVAICLLCQLLRDRGARPKLWASLLFGWYIAFLVVVLFVQKVDAPEGEIMASATNQ